MMKFIQTIVIGQKEWTPTLFSLFVKADSTNFIAGQFTQLSLNAGELFRPYSFANAPHENTLEFYYNKLSQGILTPHLAKIEPGMPIWIVPKGAGKLVLEDLSDAPMLWLFATGTGLGPFLSILKTAQPWQRFSKIILVHSVRFENELTHQSLIQEWNKRYFSQFFWIPIVTREPVPGVFTDRITPLLESGKIENVLQFTLDPLTSQVMLCGNPDMILDVTGYLQNRGFVLNRPARSGQITSENYWKPKFPS